MNPRQTVVYSTLASFVLFILAGRNAQNRIVGKLTRQSTANLSDTEITTRNVVGWATLFVILLAMSDVEATNEIAQGFAILLLVSSLGVFGPEAFKTLTGIQQLAPKSSQTPGTSPRIPPTAGGPS